MNISITRDAIDTILSTAGTQFVSVLFEKKDKSERQLTGHLKCSKHLKGGESTIAHKEDLVSIYDVQAKGYRCFAKSRVKKLTVNGNTYIVK